MLGATWAVGIAVGAAAAEPSGLADDRLARSTQHLVTITEQVRQAAVRGERTFVMLRGGRVLSGEVSQAGQQLVLRWADGSQAKFALTDVEALGASVDDLYFGRLKRSPPTRVAEKVALAQWCLEHDLPARAADQYLAASLADPRAPGLGPLGKRLDALARGQEARRIGSLSEAPAAPSAAATTGPPVGAAALLRPVAHEEEGGRVSPAVFDDFQHRWQPLLLNACATARCHGTGAENGFVLTRGSRDEPLSRKIAEANLAAVMAQTSRDDPADSPLVTAHRMPDGSADPIAWPTATLAQLPALVRWLERLAPVLTPGDGETARLEAVATDPADEAPARPATIGLSRTTARRPGADGVSASGDPYDPMLFNRRYHAGPVSDGPAAAK